MYPFNRTAWREARCRKGKHRYWTSGVERNFECQDCGTAYGQSYGLRRTTIQEINRLSDPQIRVTWEYIRYE